MTRDEVIQLYKKEREYQRECFGEYIDISSLSFPSFLLFVRQYLKEAEEAYCGKWEKDLPEWLISCDEYDCERSAPAKAYEQLVKVFALAGAALETYSDINADAWRKDLKEESKKWRE